MYVPFPHTFTLLAYSLTHSLTCPHSITKAGGAIGIFTAFVSYYIALSQLLAAEEHAIIRLPLGVFKG
jgi:succinate-acetate transporter protein